MTILRGVSVCMLALFAGCDSKVTSTLDQATQDRVETLTDCFPELYRYADSLLEISQTWRLGSSTAIADPTGLLFTINGGTSVDVTYPRDGVTIAMTIRFYSPTGAQQTLSLAGSTLNLVIQDAANELRNLFPGSDPFMVGDYTISGNGISGSDSLTAIIGGSTNQNELEEVRTTAASSTISGGPPAVDSATISDSGPPACAFTFTIPSLLTDETPTQEYPIGTVNISVTGPVTTVTGTITFDGSATAVIDIADVPGTFAFNVDTRTVTFVP